MDHHKDQDSLLESLSPLKTVWFRDVYPVSPARKSFCSKKSRLLQTKFRRNYIYISRSNVDHVLCKSVRFKCLPKILESCGKKKNPFIETPQSVMLPYGFCYEITQLPKRNFQPPRSSQWVLQRTCPSPRAVGQKEPPQVTESPMVFKRRKRQARMWESDLNKTWVNKLPPSQYLSVIPSHPLHVCTVNSQQFEFGDPCLLCIFNLHQHRLRALILEMMAVFTKHPKRYPPEN